MFGFCSNGGRVKAVRTLLALLSEGRQTWRKYPINFQDISSEAASHPASELTLAASMSKCHYKRLHISQGFYLMVPHGSGLVA